MHRDPDEIDVTGYDVEASDGAIGEVNEVVYEEGGKYLVVDAGPWIFGRKLMLPDDVIERIDRAQETIYIEYSKDVIKHAPEFDAFDPGYRRELDAYYGRLPGGPDVDPDDHQQFHPE